MKKIKIEKELIEFKNLLNETKLAIKINGLTHSLPNMYAVKWVNINGQTAWTDVSKEEFKQLVEVIE